MRYIRYGEQQGFANRPTSASRDKWWDLGEWGKSDMLWCDTYNERFGCFVNAPKFFADKRFFNIRFNCKDDFAVNAAFLNSTVIPLLIEVDGITNFGEGAIYTNVYQLQRLGVLQASTLNPMLRRRLLQAFQTMCKRKIKSIFEEVTMKDRLRLDAVVLEAIGFTTAREREKVQAELYHAVCALVQERLYKAQTVKSKASSAGKANVNAIVQELLLSDFPAGVRKQFPQDFAPDGGKAVELPEGEVKLGSGIFDHTTVTVGEETLNFDTPEQASFVAIAAQCGNRTVSLPDSQRAIEKALADYRRYAKALESKVTAAVQSATPGGRVRKAVEAELRRRLHIVDV